LGRRAISATRKTPAGHATDRRGSFPTGAFLRGYLRNWGIRARLLSERSMRRPVPFPRGGLRLLALKRVQDESHGIMP
jgi:hypothetical protein